MGIVRYVHHVLSDSEDSEPEFFNNAQNISWNEYLNVRDRNNSIMEHRLPNADNFRSEMSNFNKFVEGIQGGNNYGMYLTDGHVPLHPFGGGWQVLSERYGNSYVFPSNSSRSHAQMVPENRTDNLEKVNVFKDLPFLKRDSAPPSTKTLKLSKQAKRKIMKEKVKIELNPRDWSDYVDIDEYMREVQKRRSSMGNDSVVSADVENDDMSTISPPSETFEPPLVADEDDHHQCVNPHSDDHTSARETNQSCKYVWVGDVCVQVNAEDIDREMGIDV